MIDVEQFLLDQMEESLKLDYNTYLEELEDELGLKNVEDIQVLRLELPRVLRTYVWSYRKSFFDTRAAVIPVTIKYTTSDGQVSTVTVPCTFGFYTVKDTLNQDDLEEMIQGSFEEQPFFISIGKY